MSGGWGTRKKPPSNDPERPPKGPASGSLGKPRTVHIVFVNATAEELADAPDWDD